MGVVVLRGLWALIVEPRRHSAVVDHSYVLFDNMLDRKSVV